jgi:hypothetical protein
MFVKHNKSEELIFIVITEQLAAIWQPHSLPFHKTFLNAYIVTARPTNRPTAQRLLKTNKNSSGL